MRAIIFEQASGVYMVRLSISRRRISGTKAKIAEVRNFVGHDSRRLRTHFIRCVCAFAFEYDCDRRVIARYRRLQSRWMASTARYKTPRDRPRLRIFRPVMHTNGTYSIIQCLSWHGVRHLGPLSVFPCHRTLKRHQHRSSKFVCTCGSSIDFSPHHTHIS